MELTGIPFVKKVGISKNESGNFELKFDKGIQNHLETVHAGAQFVLAEMASGECLQLEFPDLVGKVIPMLRDSQVKFRRPATGDLIANSSILDSDRKKFLEQFSNKGRALMSVAVDIMDRNNQVTCSGTYSWFVQKI